MKTKVARNTSGSIRTDSLILKLVRLDGVVRMVCGMVTLQKDRTVDRWLQANLESSWSHSIIQLRILYCIHMFIALSP
jgi:hypothetical protein